ncbi:hypothetical protein Avbf_06660 [Armadillidium vulgare]|nr:hypothetical protein Avbf_06660 [Armadillidium vulgare]
MVATLDLVQHYWMISSCLCSSSMTNSVGFNSIQRMKFAHKEFTPRANEHNGSIIFPSRLLSKIKMDLKILMVPSEEYDSESNEFDVKGTIMIVRRVLEERQDVTFALVKALQTLYSDWMAAICVSRPDLINNGLMKDFLNLWKEPEGGLFPNPNILCVLFSARTIMLLGQKDVNTQTLAWKILEEFILEIVINFELISVSQIQETFISLLRYEWPKSILEKLSHLVKNLVDVMMKNKKLVSDDEALHFMDWVGWFTTNIEI